MNLPEDVVDGVVITRVARNTSASNAGLEPSDVIVGFNGEEVSNSVKLRQLIYSTGVGETVEIEYYRDGEPRVASMEMEPAENN